MNEAAIAAAKELERQRFRNLIDGLQRINMEMKYLEERAKTCKTAIGEVVIIDNKIYEADIFNQMEKDIKTVINNIDQRIVPNLINEMYRL